MVQNGPVSNCKPIGKLANADIVLSHHNYLIAKQASRCEQHRPVRKVRTPRYLQELLHGQERVRKAGRRRQEESGVHVKDYM